jgi:hypothetical protein
VTRGTRRSLRQRELRCFGTPERLNGRAFETYELTCLEPRRRCVCPTAPPAHMKGRRLLLSLVLAALVALVLAGAASAARLDETLDDGGRSNTLNAKCTRRRFLGAAAAAAVWVALGGTVGCESNKLLRVTASHARAGQAWTFRSRPEPARNRGDRLEVIA